MKNVIKSPLNYTGAKHRLLPQILPLLPNSTCFVDLFAGGATVAANINADHIIINDINTSVLGLFEWMYGKDPNKIISDLKKVVRHFGLSDTSKNGYAFYGCDSSAGLASHNKAAFIELRSEYNKTKEPLMLYALIVFAFNNQVRFNASGAYNLPVGKRDFNQSMQDKLVSFITSINAKSEVIFTKKDFRLLNTEALPKDTLIYCDPPYLITTASYNESGGWTEKDELDLLAFLELLDNKGFKFALSNVLEAKNQENVILKEWLISKKFTCHNLVKSYANSNYQRKNKGANSTEVLITNN